MKLSELASRIGAEMPAGTSDIEVTGASGIDSAVGGSITFLSSNKLVPELLISGAAAVIVNKPVDGVNIPQIKAANPLLAFAKALAVFYKAPFKHKGVMSGAFLSGKADIDPESTIYPGAYISDGASIGKRTTIHPGVYIGEGSSVGDDCIIYPNVAIREGIQVGSRVTVHSGSVIGSDGFGYVPDGKEHFKIPQVGGVVIEDDVEIGACVTIDRATTDKTVIGEGTKIDNLVQIGHNVRIGRHCIIVAHVAIGGSTKVGNHVTLAGHVAVNDHVSIADGCIVGAKSGVAGSLEKGLYSGIPAIPHSTWLRASAVFKKLPELFSRLRALEKKMGGNNG